MGTVIIDFADFIAMQRENVDRQAELREQIGGHWERERTIGAEKCEAEAKCRELTSSLEIVTKNRDDIQASLIEYGNKIWSATTKLREVLRYAPNDQPDKTLLALVEEVEELCRNPYGA